MKALASLAVGCALAAASLPASAQPTDAQIAAIVLTANQVDIDAGRVAAERTGSPEVRAFARLMVTDHDGVNEAARTLLGTLQLAPASSPTSDALRKGGDANLAQLRQLDGFAFDRAYVAHEVAYHRTVLDALDTTLLPHATHPALKALLVKVRPAFVAHLDHARHLLAKLEPRRD